MKETLSLAVRNVLRNRRRSMTTVLAMVVGVCAILLFGGFTRDVTLGLQTDFVQHSGHLQIQREGYYLFGSGNSAAYGIADYPEIIDALKADPVLAPMLLVATPVLQLGGIAGNFSTGTSRTVLAQGIVVDEQNRMREWNDYRFPIVPQRLGLAGTEADAAIIGHGVARVLGLCAALHLPSCAAPPAAAAPAAPASGASALAPEIAELSDLETPPDDLAPLDAARHIEILAASARGAPNVAGVTVVKAERQGVKEIDDVFVALHLPRAQRLVYGADEPQVTAVMLQFEHTAQLPAARARIDELLRQRFADQALELQDFAALNPFYDQTNNMFSAIFGFIFVLIGVIVLFVVSNTMSMAIVERTVEIGTLRAIGLRRAGIQSLFVTEGLVLGLFGALLGVATALLLAYAVNHSGLHWMPPARVNPVALTVRVWGEFQLMLITLAALIVVAAVSAWLPARRASRLPVVDALRHV